MGFDDPWFNLTAEVEVGPTRAWCRDNRQPFSLACWFAIQRAVHEVPALRQRLRPEGVIEHEQVRIGATAIRENQTFTYVYYPHRERFSAFVTAAQAEQKERLAQPGLLPDLGDDDLMHCTVVPWVRFTGLKHARHGAPSSVPKIALGRATEEGDGVRMPVNVQAHHALVDGVHIGAFLSALERLLGAPEELFGEG